MNLDVLLKLIDRIFEALAGITDYFKQRRIEKEQARIDAIAKEKANEENRNNAWGSGDAGGVFNQSSETKQG